MKHRVLAAHLFLLAAVAPLANRASAQETGVRLGLASWTDREPSRHAEGNTGGEPSGGRLSDGAPDDDDHSLSLAVLQPVTGTLPCKGVCKGCGSTIGDPKTSLNPP